jgi:hypothetical protein
LKPKLPPQFVPENHLEQLMAAMDKSPKRAAEFFRELLNSEVVTLGKPAPGSKVKDGFQILPEETKFNMRLLDFQGQPVVPIYTTMKRMTEVIPEQYYTETGYVRMNFLVLLQMLGTNEKYTINPGHMLVRTLTPEGVKGLLDGSIFKHLEEAQRDFDASPRVHPVLYPKDVQIQLSRPKNPPTILMNKLAQHFRSIRDVEQAFLGEIFVPSSGQPPHPILGIGLAKDAKRSFDEVCKELDPTIRSVLGPRELLDIFDLATQFKGSTSNLIQFYPK